MIRYKDIHQHKPTFLLKFIICMLMFYSFGCQSTNYKMDTGEDNPVYLDHESSTQGSILITGTSTQEQVGSNESIDLQTCKQCKASKATTEFLSFADETPAQATGCDHNICLTCCGDHAYNYQKKDLTCPSCSEVIMSANDIINSRKKLETDIKGKRYLNIADIELKKMLVYCAISNDYALCYESLYQGYNRGADLKALVKRMLDFNFWSSETINKMDCHGMAPLHYAVLTGFKSLIQSLINKGAKVTTLTVVTDRGFTTPFSPLHLALDKNLDDEVVKCLIEAEPSAIATPMCSGIPAPLLTAIKNKRLNVLKYFLDKIRAITCLTSEFECLNPDFIGLRQVYPLHHAIRVDAPEVVNLFLRNYDTATAIVDQKDSDSGDTALHYATRLYDTNPESSINIILRLCGFGAKILCNKEGKTPFDYAKNAEVRRALECNHERIRGSNCPCSCVIL